MNMQEMGDLQEQACWVILYVAAVSVGTSESIVKRGAVDSIIASMRSCDRHAGVQAQGWCVCIHTQDVIGIIPYAQRPVIHMLSHRAHARVIVTLCRHRTNV